MDIQKLMQEQARIVLEGYKDFEALKRVYLKQQRQGGQAFAIKTPAAPKKVAAVYEPETEASNPVAEGYRDAMDWESYMSKYASGEAFSHHSEAFPPSLCLRQEDIDLEDEQKWAGGVDMGIPEAVWVHRPDAGRLLPESTLTEGLED